MDKRQLSADDAWELIREAFAFYGRKLTTRCGPARRKIIEKRLSEGYSVDDLVRAVHGYVHFHDGLEDQGDFTPMKWFDPETVFKAQRFDTRVELGGRPWVRIDAKQQHEKAVRARQEAAQRRLDEARKNRLERKLKAV